MQSPSYSGVMTTGYWYPTAGGSVSALCHPIASKEPGRDERVAYQSTENSSRPWGDYTASIGSLLGRVAPTRILALPKVSST
jgi:hypothetical protein